MAERGRDSIKGYLLYIAAGKGILLPEIIRSLQPPISRAEASLFDLFAGVNDVSNRLVKNFFVAPRGFLGSSLGS